MSGVLRNITPTNSSTGCRMRRLGSRFASWNSYWPIRWARAVATAPPDDEAVTDEDRRRFHNGQGWFAQRGGKCIPMEDVLAECGLTIEHFPPRKYMSPYRIEWFDEAKADVRASNQPTAMRLFEGILRFSRTGSGNASALHGAMAGAFRLRVGDYRVQSNPRGRRDAYLRRPPSLASVQMH
jgi:hypothetical protein